MGYCVIYMVTPYGYGCVNHSKGPQVLPASPACYDAPHRFMHMHTYEHIPQIMIREAVLHVAQWQHHNQPLRFLG